MAGQKKQAEPLARQLEQRARTANDYLTLRRLELLLNTDTPSPLAIAAEPRRLENADTQVTGAESLPTSVDNSGMSPDQETGTPASPLSKLIESLRARMN